MSGQQNMDQVWRQTASDGDNCPVLEGKARAEVIVVGGGFCGLSAALHLAEAGRTVALIDRHEPGWGASGRNGGQVIPGLKLDPDELTELFGEDHAETVIEATGAAPDLVFELIDRYSIQCSPRRTGWLQIAAGPNGMRQIQNRVSQLQKRKVDVDLLDRDTMFEATGALGYVGGLLDRRGGNLNPLAYARGLARALTTYKGATIYGQSQVLSVKQIKGKWVVETRSGQLTATRLLLCTNGYTDACWPRLAHTIIPFVSGAVATEPLPASLRDSILPGGQAAADNCRLLSWFGLDPDGRLVFGGRTGAWSETSDPADFRNRVQRMHKVFPQVKDAVVSHHWSGLVALTADHVPHVHRLAANLYTALGFNGRGVAMATLAGKLLALLIEEGEDKAVLPLSQPRPIPLHAYRRPAVQSAVLWKKLLDRFSP
jgi:glycine/D-amino acid oxidase-like deaminating enzyme